MPKGVSDKKFKYWGDDENAELSEFAKTPSNYRPTSLAFWENFPLVTKGARTAMSCKNRYLTLVKNRGEDFKTRSAPASLPLPSSRKTPTSIVVAAAEEFIKQEKAVYQIFVPKLKTEARAESDIEIIDLDGEDDEKLVEANRVQMMENKISSCSTAEQFKTSNIPSKRCKMSTDEVSDLSAPQPSTLNLPLNLNSWKNLSVSKMAEEKTKLNVTSLDNGNGSCTTTVQIEANRIPNEELELSGKKATTAIENHAAKSNLSLDLDCCTKYLDMYQKVRSHVGSDIKEIHLIATLIDKVVRIAYNMLGLDLNTASSRTEEILQNILTPQVYTGDNANIRKLLMFNIFASYNNIVFVEKFSSIGFKLCALESFTPTTISSPSVSTAEAHQKGLGSETSDTMVGNVGANSAVNDVGPKKMMEVDSLSATCSNDIMDTDILPASVAEDSEIHPVADCKTDDKLEKKDLDVRVCVHDLNKALGFYRDGSSSQRIMSTLNKAAELLYGLNGTVVGVSELFHLRIVSKLSGAFAKVDAWQLKKDLPRRLRNLRMDFGSCLSALISEGDVVVINGVCNLAKSSGDIILLNPAWALTELVLLKLEMEELTDPINAGLAVPMDNLPDTFVIKCGVPRDYITSTIQIHSDDGDEEILHLVVVPKLKNKILLTFENVFEADVKVSAIQNPSSDDEDDMFLKIKPIFKSEDAFEIKPNEFHNCYIEFNNEDCKKSNRLLLMFAAITVNKFMRVTVEFIVKNNTIVEETN